MTEPRLTTTVVDGIATITINRPGRLNALTWATMDDIGEAIRDLGAQPATRVIVLTGAGRAFCAGADLADVGAEEDPVAAVAHGMADSLNPMCEALLAAPVPTLVAVNGPCVGGGVGLALLADITVAARSAYFLVPQVDMLGIVPDVGATWALPRLIGRARTLGMSVLGERITAERAEQWGLIWQCVDDDTFADDVAALARKLAGANPDAVAATRRLVNRLDVTLEEQLLTERAEQIPLLRNGAFAERVGQFASASGR